MSGSSFELIAQELLEQQRLMWQMEAENCELRRQLADLRAGRGIFVEIADRRFPLCEEYISVSPTVSSVPTTQREVDPVPSEAVPPTLTDSQREISEQPELEEVAGALSSEEEEAATPTFLEEIMIDEFAAAATSPMAVWSGPTKKQETLDQEDMVALRRDLMGSFLLE